MWEGVIAAWLPLHGINVVTSVLGQERRGEVNGHGFWPKLVSHDLSPLFTQGLAGNRRPG